MSIRVPSFLGVLRFEWAGNMEKDLTNDEADEEFSVPDGFSDMLHEFAVCVIVEKPNNLHEYAAEYFTKLREDKKAKAVPMYIIVDDDDDDGEPVEIRSVEVIIWSTRHAVLVEFIAWSKCVRETVSRKE